MSVSKLLSATALLIAVSFSQLAISEGDDKQRIHDLIADYGWYADSRDVQGYLSLFTSDAVFVAPKLGLSLSGQQEISEFIGNATNNIAELKAIEAGLSALKSRDIPVRLFTDSKYALGLLTLNWKPKKNRQLVESIKKKMRGFKDLKLFKVKGHSGHPENERADYLATSAIKKGPAV